MSREVLTTLIRLRCGQCLVGSTATGKDLMVLCEWWTPDVVVLQVDVDDWDAMSLACALGQRLPEARLIGVGADPKGRQMSPSEREVFANVFTKTDGIGPVIEAVNAACREPAAPRRSVAGMDLSARELEVLALVASGLTSREISRRLSISAKTVDNHKRRSFSKLGVQNQAHAVAVAIRSGFLAADTARSAMEPAHRTA